MDSAATLRDEEAARYAAWLEGVTSAVRDALCDYSTDSGVVESRDGELVIVRLDSADAAIVRVVPAEVVQRG